MDSLYDRIKGLCDQEGITGGKLCETVKISKSALTDLKMGRKKTLSAETLSKIANYFDVTIDYLLGSSEIKMTLSPEEESALLEKTKKKTISDDDIMFALFKGADDITDEMYEEVKAFAEFVKQKHQKKSKE